MLHFISQTVIFKQTSIPYKLIPTQQSTHFEILKHKKFHAIKGRGLESALSLKVLHRQTEYN